MPPTAEDQTHSQRRQQILAGALDVFSRKGFEKATNRDIAAAAGINSPALIYYYFADKADLLRQVMYAFAPILRLVEHPDDLLQQPLPEALHTIAHTYVQVLDNPVGVAMFRLMLSEVARNPDFAQLFNSIGIQRGLQLLARLMQQHIENGTLRPMSPDAAARAFVGPLLAYIMTREVLGHAEALAIPPDEMATLTVELFLRGALPAPTTPTQE